jgi:hypothetical protein
MKKLLITIFALALTSLVFAQCNEFYPIRENIKYEYDHFDRKEKLSLHTTNTFKNVSGSGNNMTATMVQEMIDKNGKLIGTSESEWLCENGTLHFTVNHMAMEGQQAPGMSVEVSGDKMDIPSNLQVGQSLKDVSYKMKMTMSGMSIMDKTFTVKDRKVESQESVVTPAGTFSCLKITSTTSGERGEGIKAATWFARDAGLVKSETYKDGKVSSRQVLTKIVK